MKLKKGSAAAKAYMAKIRAKKGTKKVAAKKVGAINKLQLKKNEQAVLIESDPTKNYDVYALYVNGKYDKRIKSAKGGFKKATAKKVGSIKNNIIEFSDGYKFKKVSKDYAAKNFNKIEVFGIDLSNESEGLIESKNDLNSFDTFGIEFKTTKKIGSTLKLNPKEKHLGAVSKDLKTRAKNYHKDTKSHNVKISVVSGIGGIDYAKRLINEVQDLEHYSKILKDLKDLQKVIKNKSQKEQLKKSISYYTAIVKSNKNNISIIKRYIK